MKYINILVLLFFITAVNVYADTICYEDINIGYTCQEESVIYSAENLTRPMMNKADEEKNLQTDMQDLTDNYSRNMLDLSRELKRESEENE